jgi:pimeloyl-ACP methyl ester carboxylesterase
MFLLHCFIALTGNYTFLNYLMMVLCLTLLDDQLLKRFMPPKLMAIFQDSIDEKKAGRLREAIYRGACAVFFSMALLVSATTFMGRGAILSPLRPIAAVFASLQLANSYGLFAVMTKIRKEIVFEGSNDGKAWFGYEFPIKPGDDLKRDLPWVAPHMPRLDWRLWFAAMAPLEDNQWVLALAKRMLEGDTEVTRFFAVNPFPKAPPKYLRAFVYDYHFTDFNEHAKTGQWWHRDKRQSYMPALMLQGDQLELAGPFNAGEKAPQFEEP